MKMAIFLQVHFEDGTIDEELYDDLSMENGHQITYMRKAKSGASIQSFSILVKQQI